MGHKIGKEMIDPGVKDHIMSFVGNVADLETEVNTDIISAVNSLIADRVDNVENIGKLAEAIGEPVTASDTIDEVVDGLGEMLSTFKTNMMNSGVVVESSDKFKALIDKIKGLTEGEGKGIQMATGTVQAISSDTSEPLICSVSGFSFTPDLIFVWNSGAIRFMYNSLNSTTTSEYYYATSSNSELAVSVVLDGTNTYVREGEFALSADIPSYYGTSTNCNWVAYGVGEEDTTLRDSLASILQGEGVDVTEEDDMASLITKVDSEFDRQVVPQGNAVASDVIAGKTFINSTGQLITGTGLIVNKLNQSVNITGTSGTVTVNHNAGVYPNVIMARLYDFKIDTGDVYVKPLFIDSRNPSIYISQMYDYEGATTTKSGTNRLDIDILNITENTFDIYMEGYVSGDVEYIKCIIDFVIVE